MSEAAGDPRPGEPVVFACETGFAALLGSFDGRDRRTLVTHAGSDRPTQLPTSMHEQMHEELHWSTAWGVIAAMAGLLASAGIRAEALAELASTMNNACREVHERFATTLSSGALGIPAARQLLVSNPCYLGNLEDSLALGGPERRWPWQFRESAIQMLLRTLMQPAELAELSGRGLADLVAGDLVDERLHPDARLRVIHEDAGGWWDETFAAVMEAHPGRGGDTGGRWSRDLPENPEAMESLKAWEETVLIPALSDTRSPPPRRRRLARPRAGRVSGSDRYPPRLVSRTRPADWELEVFAERRRLREEMLGAEREALQLYESRASLSLCEADELPNRAREFLLDTPQGPVILAVLLERATVRRQFAGLDDVPIDGPPLLAMAGRPAVDDGGRQLPLALMRPGLTPSQLSGLFARLPVITLSSLRASLHEPARQALLELDEAYLLIDLPLRVQVAAWIEQTGRVRLRTTELSGPSSMNLLILQPDGLPWLWMLCFRSDAGIGKLAQLLDRHPDQLTADLEIPAAVVQRIGIVAGWIHSAWRVLEETGS